MYMDYLDNFGVNSTKKKCHRVRSWYLYEQYKTLEKNQLDAAELLKTKSYQNYILRQELKERKARRKLCDQYGLCQNELKLNGTIQSCLSVSTDDLYESLCELHKESVADILKDCRSCDSSHTSKNNDNINGIANKIDDFSDSESIQSVIDNVTLESNSAHNVQQELEIVKRNIAKNINLQLETVKDNIECLELFSKHSNDDCFQENIDVENFKDTKFLRNKTHNIFESLVSVWSNLVVFASNSIQLNPGNCYSHCSSQLLTAVLACDFLRRGVDGICHILQSYVSPIKYATSDSESCDSTTNTRICECRRKNTDNYEKSYKITDNKHCSCNRPGYKWKTFDRRCFSENRYKSNYLSDNRINERICRGSSEPWRCSGKYVKKSGGKYSNISHYNPRVKSSNKNLCHCHYLKDIVNPILKVVRYIETILQDLEENPIWL